MRGVPQPPEGNAVDAPTRGWWKAKDGSWHPHPLVEVQCPACGLKGGAPANLDVTSCPECDTIFDVTVVLPVATPPPPPAPAPAPPSTPFSTSPPRRRRSSDGTWTTTIVAVGVALVVVVIGAVNGRKPAPVPVAKMHFCTSGSAPTVDIKMTIGSNGATSLASVPNGHCAVDQRFVSGSKLNIKVWNTTGVGEVACTIVRNGHQIDTARSALRTKPATCDARA